MRRRPLPPHENDALKIVGMPKPVDMSPSEILDDARSPSGATFGSTRHDPRWEVTIVLKRGCLFARLMVNDRPVLNLDHHAFEARGGIEPGYHWDIRPPLVPDDRRIYIRPQPADPRGALELLLAFWYVELAPEQTATLRWSR